MIEEKIIKARDATIQLFKSLLIQRVIYVDDKNVEGVPLESVLASITDVALEKLKEAVEEFGLTFPAEREMWEAGLKKKWEESEIELRTALATKLLALGRDESDEPIDDLGDAAILSQIIPEAMLKALSPRQWEDQKDALLEQAVTVPTLFPFDQDLGGSKQTGGIEIIRSILSDESAPVRFCGLITHTVLPEDQISKWKTLSTDFEIPRDKFIVIPKLHLSVDPELICYCLRLVALSPHFAKLKTTAKEVIELSTKEAADRIDQVSIFDLEYMVFRSGLNEGHWEPDVLFRLHSLFQRTSAKKLAQQRDELEAAAEHLRLVSSVPMESKEEVIRNTWQIQNEELYENPEYLNGNRLPLELGDIFQKGEGGKKYILVAQPCDLMIRPNGKRQPELEYVALAELKKGYSTGTSHEDLPYYGANPRDPWHVHLKRIHLVKVCILDLCSFNSDGKSIISLADLPPRGLRPSLCNRYFKIQSELKSLAVKVDEFAPVSSDNPDLAALKSKARNTIQQHLFSDSVFKGKRLMSSGANSIEFACARVGRISPERAFGLLIAYTSSIGRPAYPIDIAAQNATPADVATACGC